MPRAAKPFLHRDWYVSRAGGEYVKLCPRSDGVARAREMLREHLDKREQERRAGGRDGARLTVSELFILFLQAVEAEKSPHTFADYQRWCVGFAKLHGKRRARDLTRLDATQFKQHLLTATWVRNKQGPRPYKPKTINHAIISLRRAFNWAVDNELLAEGKNPFARLKLLPCQGRKRVATRAEYDALLAHCTDDHFRHVLVAMRYTPARPGDIRNMTWAMVDWERRLVRVREHKTSKTARTPKALVFGLVPELEAVLRERQSKHGVEAHVFLNEDGKPWKRNALGVRMRRLRKRAGVVADASGEEFVLYTQRHTFISAAGLDASIPEAVRIDLAGHTDGRTTQIYTHLRDETVAEAGRKVADSLGAPGRQPTPGK